MRNSSMTSERVKTDTATPPHWSMAIHCGSKALFMWYLLGLSLIKSCKHSQSHIASLYTDLKSLEIKPSKQTKNSADILCVTVEEGCRVRYQWVQVTRLGSDATTVCCVLREKSYSTSIVTVFTKSQRYKHNHTVAQKKQLDHCIGLAFATIWS